MPEFALKEWTIIAAIATLTAAWIKLMRQKGDPRLIVACGLLAYFLPIVGPLAALLILNGYDRLMPVAHAIVCESRRDRMMYTRVRQHAG
ncbi:MAG: hypothetical protein OXG78_16170 [Chloroflexi bacterium]|nr:hypothetical protein [Chloroflexota bacterium]